MDLENDKSIFHQIHTNNNAINQQLRSNITRAIMSYISKSFNKRSSFLAELPDAKSKSKKAVCPSTNYQFWYFNNQPATAATQSSYSIDNNKPPTLS